MAAIDELKQLLTQDLDTLGHLGDLLAQEKTALTASDVSVIEPLTQQKNALLDQVRDRAKSKIRALVAMGYRPETGDPSRFIRSSGLTELTELWSAAEQALKRCQQQNQTNSRIVGHLQQRLARLTDIFRGSAGQSKLYGATGQQTSLGQRNILASA